MLSRNIVAITVVLALIGCSSNQSDICLTGYNAARNGEYENGVELLNECLSNKIIAASERATALQARAWAHHNLNNNALAVQDQEAAFKLKPAAENHEFINYASYLRRVKRYQESVAQLYLAAKNDENSNMVSMVTQYNLGWSLYELGKYNDAIKEFTKGIPMQPDFPFVYWRRGMSYHALDMGSEAKEDFIKMQHHFKNNSMPIPVDWKIEIDNILSEYNLNGEIL